jgi:RNase P subunit RPR2
MALAHNKIIYKIPCKTCTTSGKNWNIKNQNNRPGQKKYASCDCGGIYRNPYNQDIFNAAADTSIALENADTEQDTSSNEAVKSTSAQAVENTSNEAVEAVESTSEQVDKWWHL